jgi:hypothetical protein
MTAILEHHQREKLSALDPSKPTFRQKFSSPGASKTAQDLSSVLTEMLRRTESPTQNVPNIPFAVGMDLSERLYIALANAKLMTSKVSMHLPDEWRRQLFRKLDDLLHPDAWHEEDLPLSGPSFETYLRFHMLVGPSRQPNFGISDTGFLLAGWTAGRNRLTLEFLPADGIRWVLVRYLDDERETAAAQVVLPRLMEVLAPFSPQDWMRDGGQAGP